MGQKEGYWSIATEKHIKSFTSDSPHLDEIDNLSIAGKSGLLLGVIRGNGKIENIKKLEKMAGSVGISKSNLHRIILPELEKASDQKIELIKNSSGEITGISEYVFDTNGVLEIAGEVFENQHPTSIERITIDTMDETKKLPYYQNDLYQMLALAGFKEKDINLAMMIQEQFKLIQRLNFNKNPNPIISNEYIWGANNKRVASILTTLDIGQRSGLKNLMEVIQNYQGMPTGNIQEFDQGVLNLAKKVGMIDPTKISSTRGIEKEFLFTPNSLVDYSDYTGEILDDVKALLASIRFGENYTRHSTIQDPAKFLRALINYGEVGPHDANGTDYTLLETKGIVKVVEKSKYNSYTGTTRTGYCLQLVRKDVAEEALQIIQSPGYAMKTDSTEINANALNQFGSFYSPEETRVKLAELPQPLKEAQEHLSKVLRDELI